MMKIYFLPSLLFLVMLSCNKGPASISPGNSRRADSLEISRLTDKDFNFKFNNIDSLLIIADRLDSLGKLYNNPACFVNADLFRTNYYYQRADYVTGLKLGIKTLQGAEKQGLKHQYAEIFALIGNMHKENTNYPMALDAAMNGVKAAEAVKDTNQIISLRGLLAMFTNGHGRRTDNPALIKKAYEMNLQILELAESSPKFEKLRIRFYNNIAQYFVDHKQYDKTIAYGTKAVALAKKHNALRSLTYSYTWMGMAYCDMNQPEKGMPLLNQALEICKQIKEPFRIKETYGFIYQCYVMSGDFKNALENYKQMNLIADSIKLVNNTKQLGELQIKYEAAKKDIAIQQLTKTEKARSQQMTLIIVGLMVALIIIAVVYFQYRLISKKNKQMEQSQRTMNEQSEKLQLLIRELHHRVKNNLQIVSSLLSLQSNRLTDADAISAIKLGQQRIEAMSLIHRNLYQQDNPTMVNMKEFVTDLTESIMASFGYDHQSLDLELDITVTEMDVDTALPLGLILNEWLTNVFKHAYVSQLMRPTLLIKLQGTQILELKIADNGPGIPTEVWESPQRSFGVKLIKVLTKQLRGSCTVDNRKGTILTLQIPQAEPTRLLVA